MTPDEMKKNEIDNYCRLQLIKHENKGHENYILDYEIKKSSATLQNLGVNLEDLKEATS